MGLVLGQQHSWALGIMTELFDGDRFLCMFYLRQSSLFFVSYRAIAHIA